MLQRKQFEVLTFIEKNGKLTQRAIAEATNMSAGTVNKVLSTLSESGLISDIGITEKGYEALEPYRVKRAIFIAAGFGSRLVPITLNTPKPLVRVHGKRMIETLLEAVVEAEIEEIYIVRGYLGEQFDIHGGGMDLVFPHHECEIAQGKAAMGHDVVKYWMHNNMITINGTKMGKSLGNFITLDEFFNGSHKLLSQAYTPMTIRFFILQAHYRSTVDFSNDALLAAEKGLQRLLEAYKTLGSLSASGETTVDVSSLRQKCYDAMNDDMNTAQVISHLFDASRAINQIADKKATISEADLAELKEVFRLFAFDILGLKEERGSDSGREEAFGKVVDMLLQQRQVAKANKDWATSDKIRDELAALGFEIKDGKDGSTWKLNR